MNLDLNFLLRVGLTLLSAGIISFAATPLVKLLAQRMGVMDVPKDNRRMHTVPIPRMGGLAIFLAFFLAVLAFSKGIDRLLSAILLGAVVIVILGVFDDKFALQAKFKLLVQIAAACIVVFYGNCRIERLTNPFGSSLYSYWDLGWLSYPITIIWIVALTNAVNFIDGLDGLACGVSCISAVSMLVIALVVSDTRVAIVMAALAGACLGFVPFNFNPAKIFMGDVGSQFLGFILATVSILGLFKLQTVVTFAVPLADTGFAVIRRLAHGQSPFHADKGHFHHRLLALGLSPKQAVFVLYGVTVIGGVIGLWIAGRGPVIKILCIAAIAVTLLCIGIIVFIRNPRRARAREERRKKKLQGR